MEREREREREAERRGCFLCGAPSIGYCVAHSLRVPPTDTDMVYYCEKGECRALIRTLCYSFNMGRRWATSRPRQAQRVLKIYKDVWTAERAQSVFPPPDELLLPF